MNNEKDYFQQLWLKQEVKVPDTAALKRRWSKMQWRQRVFLFLDVAVLVGMMIFFIWNQDRLTEFARLALWPLMAIAAVFTFYLAWLRRHALGFTASTADYTDCLKRQLHNNIRIAWLTKHSSWVSALLLLTFWLAIGLFDAMPSDVLVRKLLITAALLLVFLPPLWLWAKRREQRFRREFAELKKWTADEN